MFQEVDKLSRKILVVDDSAFMRAILKNILVDAGYEVIGEAGDGQDAIEKYKELKPELVTMDVTMPNINGIEAARSIIDYDKDANIIICTAMGQDWMIMEARSEERRVGKECRSRRSTE